MRKAIEYLRAHPVIPVGIIVLIIGLIFLWPRSPQPAGPTPPPSAPTPGTLPPAAAPPAPAPGTPSEPGAAPPPVPSPGSSPKPVVASEAGRPDPFSPLVRQEQPGQPSGAPAPPPAPLPPPIFPGQQPGQPSAPGPAPTPEPPAKEASTAQLIGIVGNSGSVAVIRLDNRTYIVSTGDVIMEKIKVTAIDVSQGMVVLEQEGEKFELKLGGVNGAHVAATVSSSND